MIDSCVRLTLDIQETSMPVAIKTKRGDTSRKLMINLSDGGIPYHITDDCYATFTAVKSDGSKINNPCTIENCVITYQFTEQTCAAVGRMVAEIKLYGASKKLITSASFLINVFDTVFTDGDEVSSEGEMNTLDALIAETVGLINEVQDKLEKGEFVGPQGETGPVGPQGETGPAGPQGETGPVGPQGETGPAGPQGETGPAGPQGPRGETGPAGPQGETGPAGPQGPRGETGPAGPQGETGPAGPQGETGPAGPQGETGPVGPQGETGPVGPQGETGPVGPQGETGPVGPQGETGPAGPQGETGPVGPQGETGPVGPQGEKGVVDISNIQPGQLIRVKSVDESGKATAWEPVPWGWKEPGDLVDILPECSIEFTEPVYKFSDNIGLTLGETYVVNWNDVEYVCTAALANSMPALVLGNDAYEGGDYTDEPFLFMDDFDDTTSTEKGSVYNYNYNSTPNVTVSIRQNTEKVHKIPEELLPPGHSGGVQTVNGQTPDENGNVQIEVGSGSGVEVTAKPGQLIRVKEVDEEGKPTAWEAVSTLNTELFPVSHQFGDVEVFILPETELTFVTNPDMGLVMAMFTPSTMLIEDGVYCVTFAGVEYECTPFRIDEGAYYLGNTVVNDGVDNGMPFGVLVSEYMNAVISYVGETTANVSIKGIHPIPIAPEYAPEPVCIDLKALGLGTVHNADKVEVALSEDVRPVIEKQFRIAAKQGIIRLKFDYDLRIMSMLYPAGTSTGGIGGYVTLPMLIHDDTSGGGNYMMRTLYHDNIIHMQYTDGTLSAVARRVTLATEV